MGAFGIFRVTILRVRQKEDMQNDAAAIHEQFTRLWTKAQPAVASYLGALLIDFRDAEDVLQNVAVACLRKFADYDPQRPFTAWALGVARLEAMHLRRTRARCRLVFDDELLEWVAAASEEIAPELERRSAALRECLKRMPDRASRLLALHYGESLKPTDIAGRVAMAVLAVRVALSRARAVLRECIERRLRTEDTRA